MKILVLASHTDDEVLGCGGSIHKATQQGHEVNIEIFTDWDLPETRKEAIKVSDLLGAKNLSVYKFQMRKFSERRVDILDQLYAINLHMKPDLVYVHASGDVHPDHHTLTTEAIRAFKHSSILGYNLPWNNIRSTHHQCFNEISEDNLQAKTQAIQCYTTEQHRTYMGEEYQRAIAIVEGQKIGVKYAESFEVIRWIM